MSREIINKFETKTQETKIEPPVIESFLDPACAAEVWPEEVANNEIFIEQIKKHKELNDNLDSVINNLPRPDIFLEDAIEKGLLSEEQVIKLFDSFSDLLEQGEYNRIILYIPFEFLPNKFWKLQNKELSESVEKFRELYLKSWESLLHTYDVRANFVDGDVLEIEQRERDLPRVVKAAHLIPKLVEAGIMDTEEIISIMEETDDQLLKNSIADAITVLADLDLISDQEIELMKNSDDPLVGNMAIIISQDLGGRKQETELESVSFLSINAELDKKFSEIEIENYGNITEKRKKWLIQTKKQDEINLMGKNIGNAIVANRFLDEEKNQFLSEEASLESQLSLIEGIRIAIESAVSENIENGKSLYLRYKDDLLHILEINNQSRGAVEKTFRRLANMGVVEKEELEKMGIPMPALAGPFSENLRLIESDLNDIKAIIESLKNNPELSKMIFPAVLVFGSQLKGYGERDADVDLGVFIQPGVLIEDRNKLQELLASTFKHEKIRDKVVEFWLKKAGNKFEIIDFEDPDVSLGDGTWTHILFGSAWEGNREAISELREKLLSNYLYKTSKETHSRNARELYLEELERDILQYRLMHKGYEKYFPAYGGIHTRHSDDIDGESMFYDSGYRRLATKLFASRVFLPKLPSTEK